MNNYLVANNPDKNAETLNLESQYLHKNTALVNQAELDFVYNADRNTCIVLGQEDTGWRGTCTADKMDAGCIEKALCENRQLAKQLKEMQTATTSSNQRNNDTLSIYNNELLQAVNLGVGSVVLLGLLVSVLICSNSAEICVRSFFNKKHVSSGGFSVNKKGYWFSLVAVSVKKKNEPKVGCSLRVGRGAL